MRKVDIFIILNRRTGQLATGEWINKRLTRDANGRPILKSDKGRVSPWIMTVRLDFESNNNKVLLKPSDDSDFKEIRCYDLQRACDKTKLLHLAQGYSHLLHDHIANDDPNESQAEQQEEPIVLLF